MLKSLVRPAIYSNLEGEYLYAYFSQGYQRYVKYKQFRPRIELELPCLFPTTINLTHKFIFDILNVARFKLYYIW